MRAITLLVWLWLPILWTSPAAAHATLVESHPADGAVLDAAPTQLELEFNEPVAPLVLRLVSVDGTTDALERYHVDGTRVVIDAPPIGRGSHALSWRVVSEDGHPVGGSILFSVGTPSAGSPTGSPATSDGLLRLSIWSAKLAIYVALFVGIGGLCFGAFAVPLPARARTICGLSLVLGLAAVPLSVGLQGLDSLAAPIPALARLDVWRVGLGTSYGSTAIIAAFALALGLAGLRVRSTNPARALSIVALVAGGAALATSGHASTAAPQLLMRPAVFLHAIGITLWAGALLPLALMLSERRADGAAALRRFSPLIPFVVVALVASGVALAIVQLAARPSALWSTAYGRVFLAKLALLLPLFALAAVNRWRLTKPALAGEPAAARRLVRTIAVEFALVLAIIGVVAVWRFTPPPRSLGLSPPFVAAHLHADRAMAHVTVTPAEIGPVTASIELMSRDLKPLDAKEVTLVLSNPDNGIEPIRRQASPSGKGSWRVDDLLIPAAGRWSLRIDVLVSDFEQVRLEGTFEIAR